MLFIFNQVFFLLNTISFRNTSCTLVFNPRY
nr:MAG TPA: hypothetical protein [Caudoviricetes sp.]